MNKTQVMSRDPEICSGDLVFAGTRVPVQSLVQHLAAGDSIERFLRDFPTVSRDQVVNYLQMTYEVADASAA